MFNFKNMFNCCTSAPIDNDDPNSQENLEKQKRIMLLKKNNMSLTAEEEEFQKTHIEGRIIIGENNTEENIKLNKYKYEEALEELLVDPKLISEEEKNEEGLVFTQTGLVKYMEKWDQEEGFQLLYEKGNLILHYKKSGSNLSKNFYVGKCQYKIKKDDFGGHGKISLKQIRDLVFDHEIRPKWDSNIKSMTVFMDESAGIKLGPKSYLVKIHCKSPVFFISERDVLDKRIEFEYNDYHYNYSSSANEDEIPNEIKKIEESVIRCRTLLNFSVSWEDNEYFYFKSYNQMDMKMNLPESFFNMIIPFRVTSYYKGLEEQMKKLANN